jgi:hypothetical protein
MMRVASATSRTTAHTSERQVEQYLCKRIADIKGVSYKWSSPAHAGVPDRICVLPGGRVYFIEVKKDGGRLSRLQQFVGDKLTSLGCQSYTVYGITGVDKFIASISK